MTITEEDKELIIKLKGLLDGGKRANGSQVTMLYNRVFDSKLPPTNCSSCVRQRISKLYNHLKQLENEANK